MSSDYPYEPVSEPQGATPEPAPPPAPPPTPWTFKTLFLLLGFALVALLVTNLFVLAGYELLRPRLGWNLPPQALAENPFFLLAYQTSFYILLFVFIYLWVTANSDRPFWETMLWRWPRGRQGLGLVAGGIVLAAAVQLMPPLLPESRNFRLQRLFTSPEAGYAIGAFAILVAPFIEELVFRGVLFAVFEKRVGLRFAVLATAVLFAGLHVQEYWPSWNNILMIFVVGLVFSMARGRSGSLTPSVFLHFGYNLGVMLGLYSTTQHFRDLGALFLR